MTSSEYTCLIESKSHEMSLSLEAIECKCECRAHIFWLGSRVRRAEELLFPESNYCGNSGFSESFISPMTFDLFIQLTRLVDKQ